MRKKVFRRKIRVGVILVKANDKEYQVEVHYSNARRTLSLRLTKKGFICNAPIFLKEDEISSFLASSIPALEKKADKKNEPINGDKVWIFGEEIEIPGFSGFSKTKQNAILKGYLLPFLEEVSPLHEKSMGIGGHYEIKVRDCHTVYGVNHRYKGYITYSLCLVHFRKETIESVVAHELSHNFYSGHGPNFYRILLKECPNYWYYRKKLIRYIYD